MTSLEAYDWIEFSGQLSQRLALAQAELEKKRGLVREKDWLATAVELAESSREAHRSIHERAPFLPELEGVRTDFAALAQNQWVDGLEKLFAGLTFHLGNRAPVLELLFPHLKFATLRRVRGEGAVDYALDFNRRLGTTYVGRIFSQPDCTFAQPVLALVQSTEARWRAIRGGQTLPDETVDEVRQELILAGQHLAVVSRQAKLLAEAALVPLPEAFERAGLGFNPRKRPTRKTAER